MICQSIHKLKKTRRQRQGTHAKPHTSEEEIEGRKREGGHVCVCVWWIEKELAELLVVVLLVAAVGLLPPCAVLYVCV